MLEILLDNQASFYWFDRLSPSSALKVVHGLFDFERIVLNANFSDVCGELVNPWFLYSSKGYF